MNHKSLFFVILSATILTTACEKSNNSPTPDPTPVMNIDIQVNVTTDFTVGLTLIPESADNEYFTCILTAEEFAADSIAAAAEILEMAGNAEYADFRFKGNANVIFNGLEAATDYIICTAVYGDETTLSSTARLTTEDAMERLEITGTADILDWGQEYEMTNAAGFTFRLGDAELREGENWETFVNGHIAEIYAVRSLEDISQVPENALPFCGVYASGEGKDTPGIIVTADSYSSFLICGAEGMETEVDIASGTIQMTQSGEEYAVTALVTLEDGTGYSAYYKGSISLIVENGYYGIYNYKPSLKEDITGLDYPLMKYAYYCGEVDGMSKYSLSCVNDPDPDSPFGGYNKHCIKMEFYVPSQEDPYAGIPAGEYPVSAEGDVNTTIAGDYRWYNATSIDLLGSYYYMLDEVTFEQTQGFFTDGRITVDKDGDGYVFTIDARTWDGYTITGTSTQESLVITDEPEW